MAASTGRPLLLGPASPIPDKLYFKIGEVAKLVGVQAHVLRYWQSEIAAIRPSKSVSNQRRYRYRDVEIFREIRRLLYDERYTLAGARRRIVSRETPADEGSVKGASTQPIEPIVEAAGQGGMSSRGDASADPLAAAAASVPAAEDLSAGLAPTAAPAGSGAGEVVPLPSRVAAVASARADVQRPFVDDEHVQKLRRGLKDLIRLAGEEP